MENLSLVFLYYFMYPTYYHMRIDFSEKNN